jgi:tetratricopeptide (TPR) repeat protein
LSQKISIDEAIKRGFRAFNEGKLGASQALFLSIIKVQPDSVKANYGMALTLTRLGKFKEALAFLSFCQNSEVKNINFFQEYIKILIKLGRVSDARNFFNTHKKNYENNDQLTSLYLELNPDSKLDFFYSYLENLGIFSCKPGEIMKFNDEPIPLLTNSFLNWFETQSWSNKKLLELGSGSSTLYFSKYFSSLTSLETNQDWYYKILKEIPETVNVKLTDSILHSIEDENIDDYDVVLIDPGENRAKIARLLVKNKFKGIIFFDNSEWYRKSIKMLVSHGYFEIPFFGIKPVEDWVSCTSVLIRHQDMAKILNSDWQKLPKFSSFDPSNQWDIE